MADEPADAPAPTRVLTDLREGTAPSLAYRAPRDDPPGATAGDVLQGAVAAVLLLVMIVGIAGLMAMVVARQNVGADAWGVAEWIFFAVGSALMALGALAALRSLRYYLTGRHRRRVAAQSPADATPRSSQPH